LSLFYANSGLRTKRILFFERYIRKLTYSILAYAYPRALVFSARLKALSDRSGDRSAGGRRFYILY